MTDDIVQTLRGTEFREPIDDPEAWAERLIDAGLLAPRQAQVLARVHGTHMTRQEIADGLGVTASAVDQARMDGEPKLREAEATLQILEELRRAVRPTQGD